MDGDDNVIGSMPRFRMRQLSAICRVTYILVFNTEGRLLVQRRTPTKDQYPGLLDFTAGGVVVFDETYETSASRELNEELGVDALLVPHGDIYFEDPTHAKRIYRSWGRLFSCQHNGPFHLQAEEVESAEFIDLDTALSLDPKQVTPDSRQVLLSYLL